MMKAIKPRRRNRRHELEQRVKSKYKQFETTVAKDMDNSVKTWRGKPKFRYVITRDKNKEVFAVEIFVGAPPPIGQSGTLQKKRRSLGFNGRKWLWMDKGTKPHRIERRDAPTLVFKVGYKRATKYRYRIAEKAYKHGATVFPLRVRHPGVSARHFSDRMREDRLADFRARMKEAAKGLN